jgi:hypothetical protein
MQLNTHMIGLIARAAASLRSPYCLDTRLFFVQDGGMVFDGYCLVRRRLQSRAKASFLQASTTHVSRKGYNTFCLGAEIDF